MKIEHVAVWVRDLEQAKGFYQTYFGAVPNEKYISASREFESYFLCFESDSRLEIMWSPEVSKINDQKHLGFAHIAISVGSEDEVVSLTNRLRKAGFTIKSEPRQTGDGYFESVVLDPDGNPIEISI